MKTVGSLLQVIVGIVIVGALTVGLVVVFRGMNGIGQAGGVATSASTAYPPPQATGATAISTGEPYPPPQTTVAPVTTLTLPPPPPTPTFPPVPTPLPTPHVTPIPTSAPPIIPSPTGQPVGEYKVAFVDGNTIKVLTNGVVSLNIDVHAQTSLFVASDNLGIRTWGSPSPDGKYIAIVLSNIENLDDLPQGTLPQYSLYLCDLATSRFELLTLEAQEPLWSPDGTKLAYRNTQDFGLWVMDIPSRSTRQVFPVDRSNLDYWVNFFSWAPDNNRIALVKTYSFLEVGEIWITSLNEGQNPIQLTTEEMQAGFLNWSPLGEQILFVSDFQENVIPGSHPELDFIHFQEVKEQSKLAILYQEKREAYPAHG